MPHLSPMNWIMALTMMWIILLTISSSFWWMQSNFFYSPTNIKSELKSSTRAWSWLL